YHARLTVEGKLAIAAGLRGRAGTAQRDVYVGNRQRLGAELVWNLHAHGSARDAGMYDFAQGLAVVIGIAVAELRNAPATDPGLQGVCGDRAAGCCGKTQT